MRRGLITIGLRASTMAGLNIASRSKMWCSRPLSYGNASRNCLITHAAVGHFNLKPNLTSAWVIQQLREAAPSSDGPKVLIRDNDNKFGRRFDPVAFETGIEVLKISPSSPDLNPICERFLGSVRRGYVDHLVILSERQVPVRIRSLSADTGPRGVAVGLEGR